MMDRLPVVSGDEAAAAFQRIGYIFSRQSGSPMMYKSTAAPFKRLTIPKHKVIAKGTLRSLIRESGITVEEFVNLLK